MSNLRKHHLIADIFCDYDESLNRKQLQIFEHLRTMRNEVEFGDKSYTNRDLSELARIIDEIYL